jgi:hypothetical protein
VRAPRVLEHCTYSQIQTSRSRNSKPCRFLSVLHARACAFSVCLFVVSSRRLHITAFQLPQVEH